MALLEKIHRIEKELDNPSEFLDDRKCLVMDAYNVFLVQENKTINLCDYYEKSNLVDPMFSGCYILPNEMSTIWEIYERLLVNEIKRLLVKSVVTQNDFDYESRLLISKYGIHTL